MRRQPTAMPRERMQPGRHLVLSVLCLLAGTSVLATSAESPDFVVVDHNGASLLPARPLRFIDDMRGEAIRRLAELQLNQTVNVLSKQLPITTFAARLTWQPHDLTVTTFEADSLKSQAAAAGSRGGRRKPATVCTEQGVAMPSSVLRSEKAVLVNVEIMRAFVRLRYLLATNADLSRRVDALEAKYDKHFRVVFEAIRQLMVEPEPPGTQRIGFKTT